MKESRKSKSDLKNMAKEFYKAEKPNIQLQAICVVYAPSLH